MKRPFALLGSGAFAALAAAALLGADNAFLLGLACAGLGLCALAAAILAHRRPPSPTGKRAFWHLAFSWAGTALLTGAVCLFLFCLSWNRQAAPVENLPGQQARIRAVALDYSQESYHRFRTLLRVESAQPEEGEEIQQSFDVRLTAWMPLDAAPGDTVECTVTFYAFSQSGGLYSTRSAMLADGVVLGAYLSGGDLRVSKASSTPLAQLGAKLRRSLGRKISRLLPKGEAGLLRTILLGERQLLPQDAAADFRAIGVSHLLVISGLHVTALAGLLLAIFRRLPIGRLSYLLTGLGILCFLFLIGFPPSAVRGGTMVLLALAGRAIGRRPDGLNSLGLAVLLICLANPFSGGDIGFALSAGATCGVLLLGGRFSELLLRPFGEKTPRPLRFAANSLGMSFGAILGTLPIQAAVFEGMSLLAPLATLVLVLPCSLMLGCAAGIAVFGGIPALDGLAELCALGGGWAARLVQAAAAFFARIPGLFLDLSDAWNLMLLGICLLLTAGYLLLLRQSGRLKKALLSCLIPALFLAGLLAPKLLYPDIVTLAVLPDGGGAAVIQGDRAAVLSPGGYNSLAAAELLRRHNIADLSYVYLYSSNGDSREAAAALLRRYPAQRFAMVPGSYAGDRSLGLGPDTAVQFPEDGQTQPLWENVTLESQQGGDLLVLRIYDSVILLDNTSQAARGDCDLLLTAKTESDLVSPVFTVLTESDMMLEGEGPLPKDTPPGRYLLPAGKGLLVDIMPGNTLAFRGESYG